MEVKAKEHESKIALSSREDGLKHAIAAAELYMKAVQDAPNPAERSRLTRKCKELIALAERLKTPPVPAPLREPRQTRQLPASERAILLRASRLHGNVFPPWESPPEASAFSRSSPDEPLFSDSAIFSFSPRQMEIFAGWKRPLELVAQRGNSDTGTAPDRLMVAAADCDFVQDITTDCSVVASLCAAVRHLGPDKDSLLPSLMFPFDAENGRPSISGNGKYVFRMNFNGCFRQVVVDDRLPSSSTSRTLFVMDRRNPQLIWPALMEKAYLKVRGGYDFPGSNSGTDLWVLTGWIPEQIFLQSDDIELDQTWNRIKKAYDFGDVVVTLGTGRLTSEEEETLGLAGEHDYAVMDLKMESGTRRLLLKNPWCDGLVWKGVGSSTTLEATTTPLHGLAQKEPKDAMTGTFWITFEDVVQNFESLYLNWNPGLFTERQDHHFSWEMPHKSVALSFAHNPQYSLRAQADGSVWILLSRHFQDEELAIARNRSTSMAAVSNQLGFMRLYAFDGADGRRVQLPDRALHRGPYVDSPQTLLRFDARRGAAYTVVAAQDGLPLPRYTFTLSFFSRSPLAVGPAPEPLAHHAEVTGSWTRRTAGGNASTPSYFHNPQFSVAVPRTTPLTLLLCADDADLPVHVSLVWAGGRRVTALTAQDVLASSGEYRRGCCVASVASPAAEPGTYTAVVSTFEPAALASFTLRVAADAPLAVAPVPADAAGRLRTPLSPVVFRDGGERVRAAVRVARLTRASVVARCIPLDASASGSASASAAAAVPTLPPSGARAAAAASAAAGLAPCAVRVSLESGRGPHRAVLAVSGEGEFGDAAMGLRTEEVDIEAEASQRAGGLWLVVERMGGCGGRAGQGVQVEVLSDGTVSVGGWEIVDD